jgi:hypothetical protein
MGEEDAGHHRTHPRPQSKEKQAMKPGGKQEHTIALLLLAIPVAFAIAILLAAAYYVNEVRVARLRTPDLIAAARSRYGTQVTPADLSPERRAMLLAVEDPTFMRHHGVDLATPGAGMTTITQGLVKLIYFPKGFRQGIAKIRQTLIAHYVLDSLVSKDDQLLLFLNIAYLGRKDGKAVSWLRKRRPRLLRQGIQGAHRRGVPFPGGDAHRPRRLHAGHSRPRRTDATNPRIPVGHIQTCGLARRGVQRKETRHTGGGSTDGPPEDRHRRPPQVRRRKRRLVGRQEGCPAPPAATFSFQRALRNLTAVMGSLTAFTG